MFEYSFYLALLVAFLAVIAESIRLKSIDDNLLMPLVPALVILAIWAGGLISLPSTAIKPFPV